jgi:hypothetical protein
MRDWVMGRVVGSVYVYGVYCTVRTVYTVLYVRYILYCTYGIYEPHEALYRTVRVAQTLYPYQYLRS